MIFLNGKRYTEREQIGGCWVLDREGGSWGCREVGKVIKDHLRPLCGNGTVHILVVMVATQYIPCDKIV